MSARQIITDVIAALELAARLKHAPLLHSLIDSSRDSLEEVLSLIELPPLPSSPAAPPPSRCESPEELAPSVVSSKLMTTPYRDFIAQILPVLRRLFPNKTQKERLTDGARFWKLHRHLKDPEEIFKAAHAQAIAESPQITSVSIAVERLSRESD